ncbi:MAG TPA: MFS transporter [Acidimicrobiales bacterium]|nr:MFS transporter [Acidimicrobiales bacterium]
MSPRRRRSSPSPLRKALRHPRFRRLFAASTVSRWGDTFSSVALVVLVYRLTGSGLRVGATVAFEIAPVLLFGFLAGAVADRVPRRRVMVAADLGRAAIALALALFGTSSLAAVYAAAFGMSALTVFFNPAAASAVPALVEGDELVGANAALWSGAVVSQIALAPLAGVLVAWAGPGPAFVVNAASFAVSAALLAGLVLPAAVVPQGRRPADVTGGLRVVMADPFLRLLAGVQALAALSAGATSALLVVLAGERLGAGAGRFGLLIGAIGVGAGLGPLVLQRVVDDVRRPGFLFGPYLLRGAVDLVLAATTSFAVALGALAAYGVGTSTGMVTWNSVLQAGVEDRVRGRVFAFYDVVWQSARLVSIAAGGLLADAAGVGAVYVLGAFLLLAAGSLGLVGGRRAGGWRASGAAVGQTGAP